jgi:hypothetical protein
MLVKGIIIVLVILLVANVGLSAFKKCSPVDEYFSSAKRLPDGRLAALGSIPSGTDINYVGAKLTDDSFEDSFNDNNKGNFSAEGERGNEGEVTNDNYRLTGRNEDYTEPDSTNHDFTKELSAMFPVVSQKLTTTAKNNKSFKGSREAEFESSMEGVSSRPRGQHAAGVNNSTVLLSSQRDGYNNL